MYQNIFIVVVWITLSVICLILLNYFWAPAKRRVHNDVIGWQISIVGTIYAVMIGFMLYAVWANFQVAESNVDSEANALGSLYRVADGLPDAQGSEVRKLTGDYAALVIKREWPAMSQWHSANAAQNAKINMWKVLTHTSIQNSLQQVSLRQAMQEMDSLTEHRRIRRLEARTKMPAILWCVLVLGGIITIGSSCLIGSENKVLHFSLIVALSLLISMALVTIRELDQPFSGAVHVNATPFIRVLAADKASAPDPD